MSVCACQRGGFKRTFEFCPTDEADPHAAIPEDQVIMICVAMGFPDGSFPANAVVSQRKALEDAVVFVGFD